VNVCRVADVWIVRNPAKLGGWQGLPGADVREIVGR